MNLLPAIRCFRLLAAQLLVVVLTGLLVVALTGCQPVKVCMKGDIKADGHIKTSLLSDNTASGVRSRFLPRQNKCLPKVALIDVDGLLVNRNMTGLNSMGENPVALLREKLEAAAVDDTVHAVVLRINSPGGGVTASDIMRRDLQQFRQRTSKPVVACLMDVGAGGGYYLASAADMIVAHPTTITGGIGVILNLYDIEDSMQQYNVSSQSIRSGKSIDIGSPVRKMEEGEEVVLETIAGQYHQRFCAALKESRPSLKIRLPEVVPPPTEEEPANRFANDPRFGGEDDELEEDDEEKRHDAAYDNTIFDGRIFTGTQAVEIGLVDSLGYLDDALHAAQGLAGLPAAQTILYKRDNDRALTPYDITPNTPGGSLLPLSIPGLDRAQLPTFLYLWQPEPLLEKNGTP